MLHLKDTKSLDSVLEVKESKRNLDSKNTAVFGFPIGYDFAVYALNKVSCLGFIKTLKGNTTQTSTALSLRPDCARGLQ